MEARPLGWTEGAISRVVETARGSNRLQNIAHIFLQSMVSSVFVFLQKKTSYFFGKMFLPYVYDLKNKKTTKHQSLENVFIYSI